MSLKNANGLADLKETYKEAAATIDDAYATNADALKDAFLNPMGNVEKLKYLYAKNAAKLKEVYVENSEKLKEAYFENTKKLKESIHAHAEVLKPKGIAAARNARDFYLTHTNRTKRNFAIATERLHKQIKRKTLAAAQKAAIRLTLKVSTLLHKMNKSQQRISQKSRSNS